jgi:hypothetical protein
MTPDIPTLIHKLRNAPQLVGTFGRGDPDPLDEYRPGMTGEERDWLVGLIELVQLISAAPTRLEDLIREYARDMRRNSGGGDGDYPWEWAKATADYLEVLIERSRQEPRS